jgi:Uma2 family endonuclease
MWEGDWELINGYPYSMAPSPFGSHQRVITEFVYGLRMELEKKACKCQVFAELDWIIDDHNVVRPDVMIVCGERVEKHLEYAPVWIVEILSATSGFRDQIVKKEVYAEQGVRYYLIADTDKKSVTIYELINGEYKIKPNAKFDLTDHCSIEIYTEKIMNS